MRQFEETPRSTILIVEDDPDLLQAMAFSFETEGFSVRTYLSGEALLQEASLPSQACLVLDQTLPGLGGLETLQALRRRGVDLPAVLITTASLGLVARAQEAGLPLVGKPLIADVLLDAVRRQLQAAPKS